MVNPFQIIIDELRELNRNYSSLADAKNISQKVVDDDAEEVFDFLAFCQFLKISKATGYKYTSQNLVPYIKKEGKLFFLKSELIEWLKSGRVKTNAELDEEADKFIKGRNNK